jgi:hypothetical protein
VAEEKDMNVEPEEDVQAHQQMGQNAGANLEADEKGVHHREDEDDDVEAHVQLNAVELGENLGENAG